MPNGVKYTVLNSESNGPLDNVGPYKVPAEHYFMMGDNRDNSTDSRALGQVGYVPFENLVGRAALLFSTSPDASEPLCGNATLAPMQSPLVAPDHQARCDHQRVAVNWALASARGR